MPVSEQAQPSGCQLVPVYSTSNAPLKSGVPCLILGWEGQKDGKSCSTQDAGNLLPQWKNCVQTGGHAGRIGSRLRPKHFLPAPADTCTSPPSSDDNFVWLSPVFQHQLMSRKQRAPLVSSPTLKVVEPLTQPLTPQVVINHDAEVALLREELAQAREASREERLARQKLLATDLDGRRGIWEIEIAFPLGPGALETKTNGVVLVGFVFGVNWWDNLWKNSCPNKRTPSMALFLIDSVS